MAFLENKFFNLRFYLFDNYQFECIMHLKMEAFFMENVFKTHYNYIFNEITSLIENSILALPPGVQRTRELLAILKDPRLYELFESVEIIERIEKTETGYRIETDNFSVSIDIKYLSHQGHPPGPAKFELEFKQPVLRGDFHILPYPQMVGELCPSAQRIRELVAILTDRRLFETLGSVEMIERIEKTEKGYLIISKNLSLQIEVIYHDPDQIGPIQFELVFKEPERL